MAKGRGYNPNKDKILICPTCGKGVEKPGEMDWDTYEKSEEKEVEEGELANELKRNGWLTLEWQCECGEAGRENYVLIFDGHSTNSESR
jgi:hypothetical protein